MSKDREAAERLEELRAADDGQSGQEVQDQLERAQKRLTELEQQRAARLVFH